MTLFVQRSCFLGCLLKTTGVGSDLGIYVILRWTMVELGIPNSKT